MARFITSPSVSTRKFKTPCVEGCCGPKLMSIVSSGLPACRRMSLSMGVRLLGLGRRGRGGRRRGSGLRRRRARILGEALLVQAAELNERVLTLVRDPVVAALLLVVLAEREALPVVRQEDAAQVGMAGEDDPQEVVALALHPVGSLPDALDRGHDRLP